MQSHHHSDLPTTLEDATRKRRRRRAWPACGMFSECCPAGVTVQDEQGRFLLVNDAAAAQFGDYRARAARIAANWSAAAKPGANCCAPAGPPLPKNAVGNGRASRSFSPPIGRSASPSADLLLSSVRRHQRTKGVRGPAVPLGLLRRTDRPADAAGDRASRQYTAGAATTRRPTSRWPFSTSTISSISTTITAMRPATRCWSSSPSGSGCDLRDSDMLSRISGDEFLLLLNPDPGRAGGRGIHQTARCSG